MCDAYPAIARLSKKVPPVIPDNSHAQKSGLNKWSLFYMARFLRRAQKPKTINNYIDLAFDVVFVIPFVLLFIKIREVLR